MRVALIFSVVLLAIGIAACREPEPVEPGSRDGVDVLDPAGATQPVTPATQFMVPATRTVRALPRPRQPDAPRVAGRLSTLADTTWRAGEFTFMFEPGGHLIVRGGHFSEMAEAGVPGRVVNRGGVLTFDILGRTTYGTWDGTALTIENVEAARLDPELAKRTAGLP